jgi:glycosyltransferase involved in cell wall biosynthesis
MKILFLTRSLEAGGAERQLTNLAVFLKSQGVDVSVAQFYQGGIFLHELESAGVKVYSLHKKGRWDFINFIRSLKKLVGSLNPDIIHGYLPVANILSLFCKIMVKNKPKIVFGVRASALDPGSDWLEKPVNVFEAWASKFSDLVICNSKAGLDYAVKRGFPRQKAVVIPNGINVQQYSPDKKKALTLRTEWLEGGFKKVIGLVARIVPFKGHVTFLEAASLLTRRHPELRFVCVGEGDLQLKHKLLQRMKELKLEKNILWLETQQDLTALYNSFDMCCLSSYDVEGFPNVLAEAMACGVPCVATDVGDAAVLVGHAGGYIVPPYDAYALAKAMEECLKQSFSPAVLRERIVKNYSIEAMGKKTKGTLLKLLSPSQIMLRETKDV